MRILGLDPSLSSTGWGIVEVENNRLRYVADGFIKTDPKLPIYDRLAVIHRALNEVIETYHPQEAAIEQVFLNENPTSTIKLGMARGVVILAPALFGIPVCEYEPTKVKKSGGRGRPCGKVSGRNHGQDSSARVQAEKQRLVGCFGNGNMPQQLSDGALTAVMFRREHFFIFFLNRTCIF